MNKLACIIASGEWGGHRILVKNRDRNYTPEVRLVHELINGIEVLYLEDTGTGWCEGLNANGVGVVNSALSVGRDEAEKKIVKTVGKKSKDGERILEVLGNVDMDKAIETAKNFKGGIKGHTIVSGNSGIVTLEQTSKHECKVNRIGSDKTVFFTNHGIEYEDAGYTSGPKYISSVARRDQAKKTLTDNLKIQDLAPALMGARKKDPHDPNNMVRDTEEMSTTTQMVMDLTDLAVYLYVIPKKSEYLGYENRLPKGRTPKIKARVFEYTEDGTDITELDPETGKKMEAKASKVASPMRVSNRYLGGGL